MQHTNTLRAALCCIVLLLTAATTQAQVSYIITTIAGDSIGGISQGYTGDSLPAIASKLDGPTAVAVDAKGNVYIADKYNCLIRKIDTNGIMYNIAGKLGTSPGYNGDNIPATQAQLNYPYGIALDSKGNVYFADSDNSRIRKINSLGIITTIAGTGALGYNGDGIPATLAQLYKPIGMVFDKIGNLYFTDCFNYRVRKIDTGGIITTVAGTGVAGYSGNGGPATAAELSDLYGIAIDKYSNIYVAEYSNSVIRKINAEGIISTVAGTGTYGFGGDNGPATSAEMHYCIGVAIDNVGNMYIADWDNFRIRKVDTMGVITTFAGTGAYPYNGDGIAATTAHLNAEMIVTDKYGSLYIPDFDNMRVRYIRNPENVQTLWTLQADVLLYPNPNTGEFYALVSAPIDEKITLRITDLLGKEITTFTEKTNKNFNCNLDVPSGIYIFTIITEQMKKYNQAFIVRR